MSDSMQTVGGKYFDTFNTISAWCEQSLLQQAMDQCAFYNALLSKTVEGSDVWRINHAGGEPVPVSQHTLTILKTAAEISEASQGAFNIAVGPVINLWRFTSGEAKVPDGESIKTLISHADCSKIKLQGDAVTVPAGMEIDLGGIAKGYITDRIADFLRERGVFRAILNFGGTVVTLGSKPDGTPWIVGLQHPAGEHGKKCWAAVPCSDESVVTSGVYERGFYVNGVRYHHIVDPRTGWPVQNGVDCVTVCSKNSLLADGLTTALFVLGPEQGLNLAERFHVHAVYLERDGKISYTTGFNFVILENTP
ncbi:MAG: FAD:protein FMN transferase [Anaerolineae bacterium]|nr:FAD:protein FMN transferase [Anaerolineae bacterium]